MRWGLPKRRAPARRMIAVTAAVAVVGLSTTAGADIFRFTPYLIAEQVFTDNVQVSAEDRDADGVTILTARLDGELQTSRIEAEAQTEVFYSEFWGADEFDSINARGTLAGRLMILEDMFYLEGVAERREVLLTPLAESASGLLIGQDQLLQTSYAVGPYLSFELFDIADFLARASYSHVSFDRPVVGPALVTLRDVTAKHAAAKITTGERSSMYELIGAAEYLETDIGFEQRNIVGSAFLRVTPLVSVIGRIGYEKISDPSFPTVKGTIWSAGARYRLRENTNIRVEYGKRFGGTSWLGEAEVALSPHVSVVGTYTDVLRPPQLSLTRDLQDLLDEDDNIDLISAQVPDIPDPAIIDEIVRDKSLEVRAIYLTESKTYTLTGRHTNRQFPALADSDEIIAVDFSILEKLSRQLTYSFDIAYEDNFASVGVTSTSQSYTARLGLTYDYNETLQFAGGYAFRLESTQGAGASTVENVVRMSVQQAF